MQVSNLGLILFMFYMGLEVDRELVKQRARTSIPIARTPCSFSIVGQLVTVSAIVVPFAVGCACAPGWFSQLNGISDGNTTVRQECFLPR